MTVVVSLEDYRPSPRYDGEPWTDARIEEAAASTGPWTTLETIALAPVDADPMNPAYRDFTTQLGTADGLWYRIVFLDADDRTLSTELAHGLTSCSNPLPGMTCNQLGLPKGSTYGMAALHVLQLYSVTP
jgi:hypothetical protein